MTEGRRRALLHVRIERQIAGVGDVTLDAGNDVVAVGVADPERRTVLRGRVGVQGEQDDDRKSGCVH